MLCSLVPAQREKWIARCTTASFMRIVSTRTSAFLQVESYPVDGQSNITGCCRNYHASGSWRTVLPLEEATGILRHFLQLGASIVITLLLVWIWWAKPCLTIAVVLQCGPDTSLPTTYKEKSHLKRDGRGLTKCASPGVATTFSSVVEHADDFPGTKVIAK